MSPETITMITTIITAVVGLAVAIIKIFRQQSENTELNKKLDTTEKVLVAVGTAVNTVTPVLGVDKAKVLKRTISGSANTAGVVDDLDTLLKKYHLNDKPTAELANPHTG